MHVFASDACLCARPTCRRKPNPRYPSAPHRRPRPRPQPQPPLAGCQPARRGGCSAAPAPGGAALGKGVFSPVTCMHLRARWRGAGPQGRPGFPAPPLSRRVACTRAPFCQHAALVALRNTKRISPRIACSSCRPRSGTMRRTATRAVVTDSSCTHTPPPPRPRSGILRRGPTRERSFKSGVGGSAMTDALSEADTVAALHHTAVRLASGAAGCSCGVEVCFVPCPVLNGRG